MRFLRLFLIGVAMGIADLIPGISGGTIAFLSGIYEELLLGIKSLQIHSPKKIAWPFLLPLGTGIATSFIGLAPVMHFLLTSAFYHPLLNAVFFGLILGSGWLCLKKTSFLDRYQRIIFGIGVLIAYLLSGSIFFTSPSLNFWWLMFAGFLAASAMLLPGISGSYVLVLLGIYPIAIRSLSNLSMGWAILLPIGTGIALGLIVASRGITLLLKKFPSFTLSLMMGFMVGGLRCVWPFEKGNLTSAFILVPLSMALVFLLEFLAKLKAAKKLQNFHKAAKSEIE